MNRHYSCLIPLQKATRGTIPLFCIPGAGNSVTCFFDLAQALGPQATIYGLQHRGLDGTSEPHASVEQAASEFIAAIRQISGTGPCHLLGHSYGAWVAFEIACRLWRDGIEAVFLVLIDPSPPSRAGQNRHRYDAVEALLELGKTLEQSSGAALGLESFRLKAMDEVARLLELKRLMVARRLLPPRTAISDLRAMVNVFTIHLNTVYIPNTNFPGQALLVLPQEASLPGSAVNDNIQKCGSEWHTFAPNLQALSTPGNHMTLLTAPHVDTLANSLASKRHSTDHRFLSNTCN